MLGSSNISDILGVIKDIFSNFSSLIFLLLGVFIALYIFERLIEGFANLPASGFITKTEKMEVGELVKMAKAHGLKLSKKNILTGLGIAKREKRYKALLKKYAGVDVV